MGIFPDNLFGPMVAADMLPVIVIAIFFGAGILAAGERGKKIGALVEDMNEIVMKIMMMIIKITPIGRLLPDDPTWSPSTAPRSWAPWHWSLASPISPISSTWWWSMASASASSAA